MHPFVIDLDAAAATDSGLVGAKAARLAALRQAGFPVPDGFVVPAEVFRTAPHGEVTPDVEAEIAAAYGSLGDQARVVIRSSVVQPQGAVAAAAGAFASFRGIAGVGMIVRHIERCWQSATGPAAQVYYDQAGVEPDQVALAVLVQVVVEADASGVVLALGDRRNNQLPTTGQATIPALTPSQAGELARLGDGVREHFGEPQQIEWVSQGDQWWIVQVYPVSASPGSAG